MTFLFLFHTANVLARRLHIQMSETNQAKHLVHPPVHRWQIQGRRLLAQLFRQQCCVFWFTSPYFSMNSRDRGFAAQVVRQNIMYYFLGIEGQTVPQIRVPPCVCGNLLRILLANLYPTHNQPHNNDDMRIPVGWHAAFQIARPVVVRVPSRVY